MDRFMARTERRPNGCLLWTAGTNDGGYGRFAIAHDQNVASHRWIYEQKVGPIPDGLTIDHVKDRGCISRLCVEWTHLEAVTMRENVLRGDTFAARNVAKTHCPRNHPYDSVGSKGERTCRRCAVERQRRYLARKAAGLVGT